MAIMYAIIAQMVLGLLAGIFEALGAAQAAKSFFYQSSGNAYKVISVICKVGALGAWVWYFLNISKFMLMQVNQPDKDAIGQVRLAIIINVAGAICAFIPAIGWVIALIAGIVAAILTIMGFAAFQKSDAMQPVGKQGAGQLKIYAILGLVAAVLAIIPLVGWILSLICSIAAIVLLFMGWNNVSKGAPLAA